MSLMSEKDKWSMADRNIIVVLIHLFKYMSKYSIQARPLLIDALPGRYKVRQTDIPIARQNWIDIQIQVLKGLLFLDIN